MHIPLRIEDAVAVARLELGGHRTGALVDLYLFLAGDITQGVVARDRVTTAGEDIGVDILLCDVDRLLAVELVGDHHEVVALALLLFLLCVAAADEGYELTPARLTTAVLAVELVDIFLA